MRKDRERPGRDRSPILASAQAQSFVGDRPEMGRYFQILERGWTLAVARSEGRITDSTLMDQRRKGRARRREIREKMSINHAFSGSPAAPLIWHGNKVIGPIK